MSFLKTVFFSILLLIVGFGVALAQKQKVDSIPKHQDLGEVVVDGYLIKRQRATMPIQQFDAKEIKLLNANNISDVAKHLAGVSVKDYGGIGGVKTVSVRGLGASHTGVSYDGAMINDVQTGQIDLSKFTIENIADVTLSNGQPNDFFQPARMFTTSSVLSFNSIPFKNDSTNPFQGKAALKAGSFGLINPSIILNKGFAKKWSATVTADGVMADGEYEFDEDLNDNSGPANINKRTRTNSDVHSLKSEAQVVGNLKEQATLSFKTNFYYSERGLPGPNTNYNPYSKDRMLDKSYLAQIQYKNKQSCLFQYQAQGSANRAFMRYSAVDPKYPLPNNTQIDEYVQDEYYLSGTAQYYPLNKLALTTSVDYIYNDLTSTSNLFKQYNSSPIRNTILANLAAKYFTNRLTVGANFLYTATSESADHAAPDRNKWSPTVSFSYKLLSDNEWRVRGYYKNIFRLPTFAELYYHDFGYTELRPEIADQFNLGVVFGEKKIWILSDLEFTLDGYYNEVTDKITIKYGIPLSSVRNVGKVIIRGADVGFKTRLALSKTNGFNVRINYSYQIAEDRTENSRNYAEQIPYTPLNSGASSVGYNFRAFETGYNLIFSGIRWVGSYDVKGNKLDAYAEHSLYAKYSYKKVMLMGEVINFMDTQYDVIKDYPMPGRNYRLTLSYTF